MRISRRSLHTALVGQSRLLLPGPTFLRYASDSRNAPENCGLLGPLSICGAKNHCRSFPRTFGIDRLDADVLASVFEECSSHSWSSKIKAGPSIFARRTSVRASTTLARVVPKSVCAPQCFDFKSYFFVWWEIGPGSFCRAMRRMTHHPPTRLRLFVRRCWLATTLR